MKNNLHFSNQRNLLKKLRQVSMMYSKLASTSKSAEKIAKLQRLIHLLVARLKNLASMKQIKTALGSVALIFLCSSQSLVAQSFNPPKPLDTISVRGFAFPELVDWDNDGDLDVTGLAITEDSDDATIGFYSENVGSPTEFNVEDFDLEEIQLPYTEYILFTDSGDIDSDGDFDLVQTLISFDYDNVSLHFYENINGQLESTNMVELMLPSPEGYYQSDVSLVDFDNDGDLDLLSCGLDYDAYNNDQYVINLFYYENIGDGSIAGLQFADPVTNPNEFKPRRIDNDDFAFLFQNEMADFDLDGDVDIIFSALGYYESLVYFAENVDGVFQESMPMEALESFGGFELMTSGDVDGDGDVDLIFDQYTLDDDDTAVILNWLENTTIMSSVSDQQALEGRFNILGNLSNSQIVLEYEFAGKYDAAKFDIINVNGQNLYSENIAANNAQGQIEIDVSQFTSGMYHLMIYSDDKVKTLKFMVD